MSDTVQPHHEFLQPSYGLDFFMFLHFDCGSYIPAHFHGGLELIYIIDGYGDLTIDDVTTTAGPGEFLLINSWECHSAAAPHGNVNILMQFPDSLLQKLVEHPEKRRISIPKNIECPHKQNAFKNMQMHANALYQVLQKNKYNRNLLLSIHAMEILNILYEEFSFPCKQNLHPRKNLNKLNPIIDYVKQNYNRPISIEEVSAVAILQPEYFCRFFKKCTGSTFLEYLNSYRISLIYNDLINTKRPIADILEQHGFTNLKLFHRMFRERFQYTAHEIRLMSQKNKSLLTGYSQSFHTAYLKGQYTEYNPDIMNSLGPGYVNMIQNAMSTLD